MSEYYPRTIIGTRTTMAPFKANPLGELCPEAIVAESRRALVLFKKGYEALPNDPVMAMRLFFSAATVSSNIIVSVNLHKTKLPDGAISKVQAIHDKAVEGMGKSAKILITKKILDGNKSSLGFSKISDNIYS